MRRKRQRQTETKTSSARRLRKQPKMRRVQAAAVMPMPNSVVSDAARQRRKRNKQRWRGSVATSFKTMLFSTRWLSLGLLVVCIYALQFVGMSEQFYITYIPVKGVASIQPDEVVAASGLAGAHIFSVDPNRAAEQIGAIPNVVSASVNLTWPNHVDVTIVEEKPKAEWIQAGQAYWISESGQFMTARTQLPGLLRIISEVPAELVGEDGAFTQTFVPPAVLEGAFLLRDMYPDQNDFYYDPANGLSFDDARGWRVYFGTGNDMNQKQAVYNALIAQLEAEEIRPVYVSVSNQERPYYRAGISQQ